MLNSSMPSRRARERQALNNSNNSSKRHKRVVPFNESLIEKPKTLPPPCPVPAKTSCEHECTMISHQPNALCCDQESFLLIACTCEKVLDLVTLIVYLTFQHQRGNPHARHSDRRAGTWSNKTSSSSGRVDPPCTRGTSTASTVRLSTILPPRSLYIPTLWTSITC